MLFRSGEYQDEQHSRFVNERMHANIQKDGTYSVVPRMWGGLTNPKELRAIADVVEKFNAPMVMSLAASGSIFSGSRRKTCRPSGPLSTLPGWCPATPMASRCAR